MTQVWRAVDWLLWPGVVLLIIAATMALVGSRNSLSGRVQRLRRSLPIVLLVTSVVIFLGAALTPSPLRDPTRPFELVPFSASSLTDTEIVLNYVAFAWMAGLARLASRRTGVALSVLALPVAVEVAQFTLGWGRVASATDVVVGLLGAVSGLLVVEGLMRHRRRRLRLSG